MPKSQPVVIDPRDLIVDKLKEMERTINWLHKKTEIPYGTLYSMLTQRLFQVSQDNLDLINKVLETDFKLPE